MSPTRLASDNPLAATRARALVSSLSRTAYPATTLHALRSWQTRQLPRLVRHAYDAVPHYRRLMQTSGSRPGDIRDASDLLRLPVTTKRHVLDVPPRDLVARGVDPDRLIVRTTCGSTGSPFGVRRTWVEERVLAAVGVRREQHLDCLLPADEPASQLLELAPRWSRRRFTQIASCTCRTP